MDKVKVSREDMDRIKATNRHKELLTAIANLRITITSGGANPPATVASGQYIQVIETLIKKISDLSIPEAPNVTIQTDQSEVINAINNMRNEIGRHLDSVKNAINTKQSNDYEFEINRDTFGRIISVTARAKT